MILSHSFAELPEKIRQENNWLTRNHHGIEWFDGETNPKYFTSQLCQITRCVRYIYVRGSEKASYLQNLFFRNIYNLENISPVFKNLTVEEECGGYCGHHEFRKFGIFHCALRSAYKLKNWLVAQNNFNNCDGDSITQTTCNSPENLIVNDDDDENENIKAQSNNKIEKKNLQKIEQLEKEEEGFAKLISSPMIDRNKIGTLINRSTQTDVENPIAVQAENKLPKEVIQIIPLVRFRCKQINCREILQPLRQLDVKHVGIYPADRLPMVWTRSTAIVANTDDHNRPGEHWIAFFLDEHATGTYFDSYGIPPLYPGFFLRLRRNSNICRWNTEQLQGLFS